MLTSASRLLRILIVDDEALIRWSLLETLSGCGHVVVEAGDAAGVLQAVAAAAVPFDVVLLDFRLPDSNDLTLLTMLRRLTPQTPVIMMTAYGSADVLRGAIELGAFRVVGKPFEMNELTALIQEAHAMRPVNG